MKIDTHRKEKNELLLVEINQYHSIIKDFSGQSASIKQLSITIYIAFLSIYYGVQLIEYSMPKPIFIIIGILIPAFCYIYEIYVDLVRQKLRIKMQNKIVEYECYNKIKNSYKRGVLIIKIFFLKFTVKESGCCCISEFCGNACENTCEKQAFYVNLFHGMYIIYWLEIMIIILAGVWK